MLSLPSRERGLKLHKAPRTLESKMVAPFTGAWIEILTRVQRQAHNYVAPFTGAWIEIYQKLTKAQKYLVAPFTGAWIEILQRAAHRQHSQVAPFTGAWIEISTKAVVVVASLRSLPSRERGLKYPLYARCIGLPHVAPFTGAWIEICKW